MNIPQTNSQSVWKNASSRDAEVAAFYKVVAPLYSKKTVPTIGGSVFLPIDFSAINYGSLFFTGDRL